MILMSVITSRFNNNKTQTRSSRLSRKRGEERKRQPNCVTVWRQLWARQSGPMTMRRNATECASVPPSSLLPTQQSIPDARRATVECSNSTPSPTRLPVLYFFSLSLHIFIFSLSLSLSLSFLHSFLSPPFRPEIHVIHTHTPGELSLRAKYRSPPTTHTWRQT